ncbi:hypothetical protein [Legionella jordanis]|nr:hypothetical protein [Legionella jordanis]RMX04474.1 hypothetical protein EAW55_03300 [Legionella jordanis]RMX21019.1 hypothetical protein EAS68_04755 [Legionella jordanis]HAT8713439.1 hypothetical protein [Legionella jordanis]
MKWIISIFGLLASTQLFAFPCFFTLAKDSCWTNYEVKVVVIDSNTNEPAVTIDLPKGKSWARARYECQPAQSFYYEATYQPVFWQSEIGKKYMSIRYWSMPGSIGPKEVAWNIPICFPSNFSAVPFPPDATGNCSCDWNKIPAPTP